MRGSACSTSFRSHARYSDLYDFAPVAHFTFDPKGVVNEANLAGAALLGHERVNVIGVPFIAFAEMDDAAAFWGHLRRCREGRRAVADELRFSTKRGRIETQTITAPVLDAKGAVVACRSAFIDVGGPRSPPSRPAARPSFAARRSRSDGGTGAWSGIFSAPSNT